MVGPPYQVCLRLYGIAAARWQEIDGTCAQAGGFDPLSLPIDRFCNMIYAWAVERVKDREEFDQMLTAPLPGSKVKKPDPTSAELQDEGASFMALQSELAGG